MKLLHVCDSIIGGTGSYLAELLPPQAARYGADNIVLLIPREHAGHVEPRLRDAGVTIRYFRRPNRLIGMMWLFVVYHLTLWRVRPDCVHAHSFGAGVATRVLRLLGGRRRRLVFCPHGWSFDMEMSERGRRLATFIEQRLAPAADKIVLISAHELDRAREIGIAERRLALIPNGIAADSPAVQAASWSDRRMKLLFVGRFDRQKGLDVLLDAVRPLGAQFAVRIIGAAVVSDRAATSDQLDFVDFLGWKTRDEVAAQMKACDLLVVPSRWEGFGLVAVEAMREGKAVVASQVGGLRGILGDGRYGFSFPAGDAVALRTLLVALTPATLADMGARGRARFLSTYRANQMVEKVDAAYRS